MIELCRIPIDRRVALCTSGITIGSLELPVVHVGMTCSTVGGRAWEIHFPDRRVNDGLVACQAIDGAVASEQLEFRTRVVELSAFFPRSERVAVLARQRFR